MAKQKTWAIVTNEGKIFSKHIDFYNAQTGVERHLGKKLNNGYEIIPISDLKFQVWQRVGDNFYLEKTFMEEVYAKQYADAIKKKTGRETIIKVRN